MKYFKPKSVTWWASFVPLLAGAFMATEPIHGLGALVASIEAATNMTAPVLINIGMAGIGLRGAIE